MASVKFGRLHYGPLNWFFTIDGEVHEVESVQKLVTAKGILRKRLGKSLPHNVAYKTQREGMIGYYSSHGGTLEHQRHWYYHGGGLVNQM